MRCVANFIHGWQLVSVHYLHAQDALNIRILSDEISTVSDWYQLGIKLGVPDYKLDEIQRSYPTEGCGRWRVETLSLWLRRTPNSSWRSVVRALQQMGENTLVDRIQQKYIRRRSRGFRVIVHVHSFAEVFALWALCLFEVTACSLPSSHLPHLWPPNYCSCDITHPASC